MQVSNITLCDNQERPVTGGQIGFGVSQASIHTPTFFAPPDAQITIPEVANGRYQIVIICGTRVESVGFIVTGSTVSPPPDAVSATPTFTG